MVYVMRKLVMVFGREGDGHGGGHEVVGHGDGHEDVSIGSHEDVGHDGGHEDGNSPSPHISILKYSPTFCKLFRYIKNTIFAYLFA